MKVLLAGLGTSKYQEVPYLFGDHQIKSRFFSSALAQHFKPDLTLIMLTAEAKDHDNWKNEETGLEAELKKLNITYQPIDILTGKDEDELWAIFDAIARAIPVGSQVYLDVTHAFRTLGIIFLGCLVYLRTTKQVCVEGIYYGAFEAGKDQEPRPVFDLTTFLSLMDWSYAVQAFDKTGDVSLLGSLLRERQAQLYTTTSEKSDLPRKLTAVGNKLQNQAKALDLVRPDEIMQISDLLVLEIEKAANDIPKWAKPFTVVLDRISTQAQTFALAKPREANINEHIKRQLALCRWYCTHGRFLAASVLQRELLLTWFMRQQEKYSAEQIFDLDTRLEVEKTLNRLERELRELKGITLAEVNVFDVWHRITDARNDISHVGMRKDFMSVEKLQKHVANIQDQLEKLIAPPLTVEADQPDLEEQQPAQTEDEQPTGNEAS